MPPKYRDKPIPVKLDAALLKRIEEVALRMGEAKSTVMRIAMRIGLEGLDKAFDISSKKALDSLRYPPHAEQSVAVNEETNSAADADKSDTLEEDIVDILQGKTPSKKKGGARQK